MAVKLGFDRQLKEDSALVEEPTSFIYFSPRFQNIKRSQILHSGGIKVHQSINKDSIVKKKMSQWRKKHQIMAHKNAPE